MAKRPPVRRPIARAAVKRMAPAPRRAPVKAKPVARPKLTAGRYLPAVMPARNPYGISRMPVPPSPRIQPRAPVAAPQFPQLPSVGPPPEFQAPVPAPPATPGVQPPTSPPALTPPTGITTAPPGPLSQNPQLPSIPSGAFTDAQFVASEAGLRQEIMSRYNDVLRQLGYMSPEGQYVQGDVEIAAGQQRRDLTRDRGLAELDVTRQMQGLGTLFSGRRAEAQSRATDPYTRGLADLELQVPRQLGGLYEDATNILREYEIQRNQLLLDALSRRQAAAMEEL